MTNYQYRGIDISNIIHGFTDDAKRIKVIDIYPELVGSGIITSTTIASSFIASLPSEIIENRLPTIGYQINGEDIREFSIAKYYEFTSSTTINIPPNVKNIMAVLVGGGGGGGSGIRSDYVPAYDTGVFNQQNPRVRVYNSGGLFVEVNLGNRLNNDRVILFTYAGRSEVNSDCVLDTNVTSLRTGANNNARVNLKLGIRQMFGNDTPGEHMALVYGKTPQQGGTRFSPPISLTYNQGIFEYYRVISNTGLQEFSAKILNNNVFNGFTTYLQEVKTFVPGKNTISTVGTSGGTKGTTGQPGKIMFVSRETSGATNMTIQVGSSASGKSANTDIAAVPPSPSKIQIGTYSAESTNSDLNPLTYLNTTLSNSYGKPGAGGQGGTIRSTELRTAYPNQQGQKGGDGQPGYVRVYLQYA